MVQPPTYLENLSRKIEKIRLAHHKFIVLSSGTVYQINKEVVSKYPSQDRIEVQRKLLWEWSEGIQTLNGLKGIVKDQSLIYQTGSPQEILALIKHEMDFGIRYALVHDDSFAWLNENVPMKFMKISECLFLD